jgi:hypothetical protein
VLWHGVLWQVLLAVSNLSGDPAANSSYKGVWGLMIASCSIGGIAVYVTNANCRSTPV